MGFNRRKLEDQRREAAQKEAANRRATDAQVLEDAERLIAAWNERQAKRMPMIFSPTIGAAITAGFWFLWVRCPACQTINAIDLRILDRHRDAAVTSLIPALSCRSCRPNAPFAELVRSVANKHRRRNARGASPASAWRMNGARTVSLAARCPSHWRASSMMERTSRPKWNVKLKATGRDIFVFVNGLKIAKRGYPDTPQAGTWVSLEPGWEVLSSPDRSDLIVSHNGVRVH